MVPALHAEDPGALAAGVLADGFARGQGGPGQPGGHQVHLELK